MNDLPETVLLKYKSTTYDGVGMVLRKSLSLHIFNLGNWSMDDPAKHATTTSSSSSLLYRKTCILNHNKKQHGKNHIHRRCWQGRKACHPGAPQARS